MEYKIARKETYPWDNEVTNLLHSMQGSPEYLQGAVDFKELLSTNRTLPSGHQVHDKVQLEFGTSGSISNCEVIKVHFSDCKVLYDIEITGEYGPEYDQGNSRWHTRIYNVDSCFVTRVPTV